MIRPKLYPLSLRYTAEALYGQSATEFFKMNRREMLEYEAVQQQVRSGRGGGVRS